MPGAVNGGRTPFVGGLAHALNTPLIVSHSVRGDARVFEDSHILGSTMKPRIALAHTHTDREYAVAAQYAAAPKKPAELPVGKAQFRAIEGVLTIHPSGKAVTDERRVNGTEKLVMGLG
jgi:hypothetical protein